MKIFVLGGSSFLGTDLVPLLISHQHEITCWVRNKEYGRSIKSRFPQIQILEDDNLPGPQDMILNLIVDYGKNTPAEEVFKINVDLPISIIRKIKSPRILNFSTALPEEYSVYSKSKMLLERSLDKEFPDTDIKHLKFQNFYGATAREHNFIVHLIKSMIQNAPELALTNCMQKRDFIHVSDAASGAMAVIENWEKVSVRFIDVGTGEAVTVRMIAEFIKNELGSLTDLKFGAIKNNPFEPQTMKADTTILKSLGWKLHYRWQDGVRETIRGLMGQ